MNPFALLAFILIPIIVSKVTTDRCKRIFAWGFVAAPVSLGLYSLFSFPYVGIIFSPLTIFLNFPSWWLLVKKLGIVDVSDRSVVDEMALMVINGLVCGVVWCYISWFVWGDGYIKRVINKKSGAVFTAKYAFVFMRSEIFE